MWGNRFERLREAVTDWESKLMLILNWVKTLYYSIICRQTLGKSFGVTSQEAINNFHQEQKTTRVSFQDHYVINNGSLVQENKSQWSSNPSSFGKIYPSESGLIPRYSGYIPGQSRLLFVNFQPKERNRDWISHHCCQINFFSKVQSSIQQFLKKVKCSMCGR